MVDGRRAGTQCEAAVKQLHPLGITHGDLSRHNFVFGPDGRVTLIDLERAIPQASDSGMQEELENLPAQLRNESGIGGVSDS